MVIDGNWGPGKTEFCQKLIHLIKDEETNLRPIYVDAFKADHANEPLMTLMAAVLTALPEAERQPLIKKALPAIKFGVKTTLKAGTSWLLKQDTADVVDGFETELKNAGDELINHAVESLLVNHVAAEENINTLQAALAELANETPIVVFIDELDRCRPDFAVNMLENIKHVFNIEGVQFVLITNFDQLRSSINHCYGNGLDAQRYLDKFVQFNLSLSDTHKPNGHEAVLASVTHQQTLINESELLDNTNLNAAGISDFLTTLITVNQLSLREVETFVLYMEIYQTLTDKKGLADSVIFGYCLLSIWGIFLYCFKYDIADNMVRGEVIVPEIAKVLGKLQLFRKWDSIYPDHADAIMAMTCIEYTNSDKKFSFSTEEEQQRWKKSIGELFQNGYGSSPGSFQTIISRTIETLKLSS